MKGFSPSLFNPEAECLRKKERKKERTKARGVCTKGGGIRAGFRELRSLR